MPPGGSLRFCIECNNLLYPKADDERKVLNYACRNCDYDEPAFSNRVYKNDLFTVTKEQPGVTDNVAKDVTLARDDSKCPHCGHEGAVSYQDQGKRQETRMTLFYVCLQCGEMFTDPQVSYNR